MCVLIAKYYPTKGWIGIKNRDRNYSPIVSFKHVKENDMDILYFIDDITQYSEGMNSNGISILSASLMVRDDEKEFELKDRTNQPSPDGIRIKQALTCNCLKDAVDNLIESKLTGHTIVFDKNQCFLLEGAWVKGGYKDRIFKYNIREVSKNENIVRTNHGVLLPWAGYQYNVSDSQTHSRVSSEFRKNITEYIVNDSTTPYEIMNSMTLDHNDDPQMNPRRIQTGDYKMMTTSQMMLVPSEFHVYFRNINGTISSIEDNVGKTIKLFVI